MGSGVWPPHPQPPRDSTAWLSAVPQRRPNRGSACDGERTDLARLNQPPDASAAGNASATGGRSGLGPMVIEVNANPDLNAIASLMPAVGVDEYLTSAIVRA